jgi:hypothetical protein
MANSRRVVLRDEVNMIDGKRDSRWLAAPVAENGDFVIEGQDLGPSARFFGPGNREYEWDRTVSADRAPRLVKALSARPPGTDVLDALEA